MADGLRPVDEDAPVEIFSDDSMGAWEERDVLKDRKESDESHTSILHDSSEGSGAILEQTKSQQREHEPNPLRKFRDRCGDLVNNERVQLAIILLIVINAAMMGIATFDFIEDDDNSSKAFETTDTTFLIIFTIELGLQFVYRGLGLFTDAWLVFDFIIVLLSWSLEGLQIVRAFRIFRAFRLVTRLEILRNLVLALFRVAPSLTAIVALLVLILYIFAVLCTQLFQDAFVDGITDRDYFGSLDKTLFTLFEMMTLYVCSTMLVNRARLLTWFAGNGPMSFDKSRRNTTGLEYSSQSFSALPRSFYTVSLLRWSAMRWLSRSIKKTTQPMKNRKLRHWTRSRSCRYDCTT